jgi:hypothetical protein
VLNTYLSNVDKDERYRYELVKRMITVKAKKQSELASKRRSRSGALANSGKQTLSAKQRATPDVMSIDSGSQSHSPHNSGPLSPKSSPVPTYPYEYRSNDHTGPKPFQHNRAAQPLSPQSAPSNPVDISDIFLAQTQRIGLAPFSPNV